MSDRARLLRLTEHSRTVEQEFLGSLTEAERSAVGSADGWAAKDLIAHLTAWRHRGTEELLSARRGDVLAEIEEFDPVNLEIFEAHRHLTLEEITTRSVAAWQAFSDALRATPDELLLSSEPSGGRRPLWRHMTIEAVNHPVTHMAEFALQHGRPHLARGWVEAMIPLLLGLDSAAEWHGVVHYNLACHQAQTGQPDAALASLEVGLTHRPDLREWSTRDPDLEPLRGHPRFASVTGQSA